MTYFSNRVFNSNTLKLSYRCAVNIWHLKIQCNSKVFNDASNVKDKACKRHYEQRKPIVHFMVRLKDDWGPVTKTTLKLPVRRHTRMILNSQSIFTNWETMVLLLLKWEIASLRQIPGVSSDNINCAEQKKTLISVPKVEIYLLQCIWTVSI